MSDVFHHPNGTVYVFLDEEAMTRSICHAKARRGSKQGVVSRRVNGRSDDWIDWVGALAEVALEEWLDLPVFTDPRRKSGDEGIDGRLRSGVTYQLAARDGTPKSHPHWAIDEVQRRTPLRADLLLVAVSYPESAFACFVGMTTRRVFDAIERIAPEASPHRNGYILPFRQLAPVRAFEEAVLAPSRSAIPLLA